MTMHNSTNFISVYVAQKCTEKNLIVFVCNNSLNLYSLMELRAATVV
jgi:hypothetical protein